MREQPYDTEDLLQALIADHPRILAEDSGDEPTQWLLVKREAPVGSWSLDHLYLDHEGIPTLIEVKRSSDTRLRREVVAQMLDYAANAATHWTLDSLRAWFEAECERVGVDPDEKLAALLSISDVEAYWESVKTNLAAERIRLVFVADEIPAELRSIIEYLNRQMSETEVFAVEVKQYVDETSEQQMIVPRIIGRTEASKAAKTGRRSTVRHDATTLVDAIRDSAGDDAATVANELLTWADERGDVHVSYATQSAGFALVQDGARILWPLRFYSDGSLVVTFSNLRYEPPFDDSARLTDLRTRLNSVVAQGLLPEQMVDPYFPLALLSDAEVRGRFIAVIEWAFDEARRAHAS
jgi:hypothetical protein